ncbi:MAG: hypothetical protein ACRD6X_17955, partial [Pyrinomonadaceae bacterium]
MLSCLFRPYPDPSGCGLVQWNADIPVRTPHSAFCTPHSAFCTLHAKQAGMPAFQSFRTPPGDARTALTYVRACAMERGHSCPHSAFCTPHS